MMVHFMRLEQQNAFSTGTQGSLTQLQFYTGCLGIIFISAAFHLVSCCENKSTNLSSLSTFLLQLCPNFTYTHVKVLSKSWLDLRLEYCIQLVEIDMGFLTGTGGAVQTVSGTNLNWHLFSN